MLENKLKEIENDLRYLKNDSPLSEEEKKEKIEQLENEKVEIVSLISFFSETNKKIESLEKKGNLTKDEKKELKNLRESLNTKRKDYNKKYQGRYGDVVSACFGQIGKRIHNGIYKSNSFWRNKSKRVNDRYANISKYFLKNSGISLGILLIPGLVSVLVPAVAPYAVGAASVFFGQTVIKTIAAVYKKAKYGGPRLIRHYDIKPGYIKNISDSWDNAIKGDTLSMNEVRMIRNSISEPVISSSIPSASPVIDESAIRDDESRIRLINTFNKQIEKVDITSLSMEEKERIIKFANENFLIEELSEKAKEKYNNIVASLSPVLKPKKDRKTTATTTSRTTSTKPSARKTSSAKGTKTDNQYKEKLIAFSNMLKSVDLTKLSLKELSAFIEAFKANELDKDMPEVLEKLKKAYETKRNGEPDIDDYGDYGRVGINDKKTFDLAIYYLDNPPKIEPNMPENLRKIAILVDKIKNGTATVNEKNAYVLLCHGEEKNDNFIRDIEDYLDSEYERYLNDKEEYEGRKAK